MRRGSPRSTPFSINTRRRALFLASCPSIISSILLSGSPLIDSPCLEVLHQLLRLNVARYAKSIIRILKFRRDARPRSTARHLCLMPPRTAARGSPRSFLRALRIALRRNAIVIGVEPVGAPFMDICADVEEAVGVFFCLADALRRGLPARRVIFEGFERGVAPGVEFLLGAATRCAFPFGFGWQTVALMRERAQPFAVRHRVEPGRGDDRLLWVREIRIVPVQRLAMALAMA